MDLIRINAKAFGFGEIENKLYCGTQFKIDYSTIRMNHDLIRRLYERY